VRSKGFFWLISNAELAEPWHHRE